MMSSLHNTALTNTGTLLQNAPLEPSFQGLGTNDDLMTDTGNLELGYTLTKRDELTQ